MNTYYLSLVRGLTGYYVKFTAPDEETVREHATMYFGKMWCSIYTEAYFFEVIKKRPWPARVVNRSYPIDLSHGPEWE